MTVGALYFLVSKDKVGASYVFPYCRTCFVPSFGKATVQAGIGHHKCLSCCSRYVLVGVKMDFFRMILSSLRDEYLHVPAGRIRLVAASTVARDSCLRISFGSCSLK